MKSDETVIADTPPRSGQGSVSPRKRAFQKRLRTLGQHFYHPGTPVLATPPASFPLVPEPLYSTCTIFLEIHHFLKIMTL